MGGRCQWVLDAAYQAVEWPSQPLRFDSVVLRATTRQNQREAFDIILLIGGVPNWQHPAPADYRGFSFCATSKHMWESVFAFQNYAVFAAMA